VVSAAKPEKNHFSHIVLAKVKKILPKVCRCPRKKPKRGSTAYSGEALGCEGWISIGDSPW
jgi:hypothetical protein